MMLDCLEFICREVEAFVIEPKCVDLGMTLSCMWSCSIWCDMDLYEVVGGLELIGGRVLES